MSVGFWEESEDERSEIYEGTTLSVEDFLHGWCNYFAFEWAMRFREKVIVVKNYEDKHLIHCYGFYEKGGENYYVDIRGITNDENELLDEFEIVPKEKEWYIFEIYDFTSKTSIQDYKSKYYNLEHEFVDAVYESEIFLDIYDEYYNPEKIERS